MKSQITQELLFNYFSGQVSAIQKQVVEQWSRDAANRELFYEWLHAWETTHPQYLANVDDAMARHRRRMLEGPGVEMPPDTRVRALSANGFYRIPWKIVACVTLLLLAGWQFRQALLSRTYSTAYGETRKITLSDGTGVTLNANSSLDVPRFGFFRWAREVVLKGEAVFSVKHTANHTRFVVKTDQNFDVVVLGTEFAVYNRGGAGKVVLNRGKVQLRYGLGQTILMKPGELAQVGANGSAKIFKIKHPENLSAWQDNRFVFENTSLGDISRLFEDTYGLKLVFPDEEFAAWTVSGSFIAHNADELLETLMEASSLTYTRSGDRILINAPNHSY